MPKRLMAIWLAILPFVGFAQTLDSLNTPSLPPLFRKLADDVALAHMDSLLAHWSGYGRHLEDESRWQENWDSTVEMPSQEVLRKRLQRLDAYTPLSLDFNPTVERYIEMYVRSKRKQVARMLGESIYYYPIFEAALERHGLPNELKHLAVIESALNPLAVSSAKARGIWQFMHSTGKLYGLNSNSYIDDRQDPYLASEAACRFLKDLYRMFGDWNLALAAYNSGPGNVMKAIRRSGGERDFWKISPHLPKETRGYVPAFIAANYAMNYAGKHRIHALPPSIHPRQIDTVHLKSPMRFSELATLLGEDPLWLHHINPRYKSDFIPVDPIYPTAINIPLRKIGLFESHRDSIYELAVLANEIKSEQAIAEPVEVESVVHKVKRGENLGRIAERYGVGISDLKAWNNLSSSTIHTGQRLVVNQVSGGKSSEMPKEPSKSINSEVVYYKVQPGDTLYGIARQYPGVSANDIKEWNNIARANNIKVGQKIKIHTKG